MSNRAEKSIFNSGIHESVIQKAISTPDSDPIDLIFEIDRLSCICKQKDDQVQRLLKELHNIAYSQQGFTEAKATAKKILAEFSYIPPSKDNHDTSQA